MQCKAMEKYLCVGMLQGREPTCVWPNLMEMPLGFLTGRTTFPSALLLRPKLNFFLGSSSPSPSPSSSTGRLGAGGLWSSSDVSGDKHWRRWDKENPWEEGGSEHMRQRNNNHHHQLLLSPVSSVCPDWPLCSPGPRVITSHGTTLPLPGWQSPCVSCQTVPKAETLHNNVNLTWLVLLHLSVLIVCLFIKNSLVLCPSCVSSVDVILDNTSHYPMGSNIT